MVDNGDGHSNRLLTRVLRHSTGDEGPDSVTGSRGGLQVGLGVKGNVVFGILRCGGQTDLRDDRVRKNGDKKEGEEGGDGTPWLPGVWGGDGIL